MITFTSWFGAADQSTYLQDHLLLTAAAESSGAVQITWTEARAALVMRPGHPDALRMGLTSYFNLLLTGAPADDSEKIWQDISRQLYAQTAVPARHRHANIVALALWRAGEPAGLNLWRQRWLENSDPDALTALCLTGQARPGEIEHAQALPLTAALNIFLLMAKARFSPGELEAWARGNRSPKWLAALRVATDNLFPVPR